MGRPRQRQSRDASHLTHDFSAGVRKTWPPLSPSLGVRGWKGLHVWGNSNFARAGAIGERL